MRLQAFIGFLIGASSLMSGCASFQSSSDSSNGADSTPSGQSYEGGRAPSGREGDDGEFGEFEGDTLYDLLVAEVARKRGRMDIALGNYLRQAHETMDPGIAEQATFLAQQQNAHRAKLNAATIWANVEPGNPSPRQVIAIEKMRQGDYDGAGEQLDILLSMEGTPSFEPLINGAASLSDEQRQGVLQSLYDLQKKHDDNPHIWITIAILEDQNNQFDRAVAAVGEAIDLESDNPELVVLKVRLLINHQRYEEAEALLKEATDRYPEHQRLLLLYAQILTERNKLAEAEEQFAKLLAERPDDPKLLLSLGLLAYENHHLDQAKIYFLRLLELGQLTDEANLNLGRILAQQGDVDGALRHFRAIGFGPNYANARVQSALLLSQHGRLDEARVQLSEARNEAPRVAPILYRVETELLVRAGEDEQALEVINDALKESPDDTELLFSRALILEGMDRVDEMEADLRQVLKLDERHFSAMNALGYTFADRNIRLKEAKALVQQALELAPNEPAILDSMGWVFFRLGDYENALAFLRRAYNLLPDPEVAAHLGEVLWVMGERLAAQRTWDEALQRDPGNEIIEQTRQRLAN